MIRLPEIVRDIEGLPDDAFDVFMARFRQLAEAKNFSRTEIRSLRELNVGRYVAVLTSGELSHYFRTNDIDPDGGLVSDLTDSLESSLESELGGFDYADLLPSSTVEFSDRGRVLMTGLTTTLQDDNRAARQHVDRFFKKQPGGNWPTLKMLGGTAFAKTSHKYSDDVIDIANQAFTDLSSNGALGYGIEYGLPMIETD